MGDGAQGGTSYAALKTAFAIGNLCRLREAVCVEKNGNAHGRKSGIAAKDAAARGWSPDEQFRSTCLIQEQEKAVICENDRIAKDFVGVPD